MEHTIFKSRHFYTCEEEDDERSAALEVLSETQGYDPSTPDDAVIGCRHYRMTFGEMLEQATHDHEGQSLDGELLMLDMPLYGGIYAIGDFGHRNWRYLGNNLNCVPDHMGWWAIHVFYDDQCGDIRMSGADHDGRGFATFRLFTPTDDFDHEDFEDLLDHDIGKAMGHTQPLGHFAADIYGWPKKESVCTA